MKLSDIYEGMLSLQVITRDGYEIHDLPPSGTVTIGRSDMCDYTISDPSVSRTHIKLHLGPPHRIEDLRSVNGTRVRNAQLEPGERVELPLNEVAALGSVHIILVRRRATPARDQTGAEESPQIIVEDLRMREILKRVKKIAHADISVLLLGPTGAGKEVIARRIHELSPRASHPYVALNCGTLTDNLLESELFGHEKGSFTGATQSKPGQLEQANQGTVFLDEIGEMPMSTQVKLLRVLEDRQVLRVGGLKPRPIDVRFISATNRNLKRAVQQGRFREDLYFRLRGDEVRIPPLCERVAEIEPLARSFISYFCRQNGYDEPELSPEALAALQAYLWPGNVRELKNAMNRAVLLCNKRFITVDDLPDDVRMDLTHRPTRDGWDGDTGQFGRLEDTLPPFPPRFAPSSIAQEPAVELSTQDVEERAKIVAALDECAGNQTRAAKALGISRRTLINRLERFGIARPRKKSQTSKEPRPSKEPPEEPRAPKEPRASEK